MCLTDYQVLFIKRSDKVHFMSSAHVFPGGVVEACDHTQWSHVWGDAASKAPGGALGPYPLRAADNEQLGFRVAAVRELFEGMFAPFFHCPQCASLSIVHLLCILWHRRDWLAFGETDFQRCSRPTLGLSHCHSVCV
jgi:hypothetical protein